MPFLADETTPIRPRLLKARFTSLALILLLTIPRAFAGWADLQVGMTPEQVLRLMPAPLLTSRGHGYEMWNYDRCGHICFLNGKLLYWSSSQPEPADPGPRKRTLEPGR